MKLETLMMWYFAVKQDDLEPEPYWALQQLAVETEVEIMNDPHPNQYVFAVERPGYGPFVDYLDRHGLAYLVSPTRPTRKELISDGSPLRF